MRGDGTRASRRAMAGTSVGAIIAASLVLLPAARADASPAPKAMSASERAAASGEPVEVTDQRSEYSQTFANPDGTFTLEQSSVPQRARADDGAWRAVDATLERRPDGSVEPRSAVVDLAFSGGGDGKDLLRLGTADKTIRLSWPGQLPVPRLDGPTATYPDVLDGTLDGQTGDGAYYYKFPNPIGRDGAGNDQYNIRVIVRDRKLITAFPSEGPE
ncbi:hypothetical protein ACFZCY_21410 [Streptomyces sp. NPDC007983]|uniref:hypothetical protein n=1 Tax=Streptomyces sp. NPDC007983 TaxID=3364800 RepID=UPI0036E145E6